MTALEIPSEDRRRVRDVAGTAYGMWRCSLCGEMGRLQHPFPPICPGCGAHREDLFYWPED